MNVLQVLATTSILFVLVAIFWVMYVEEWLEQRELSRTREGSQSTDEPTEEPDPVEQVQDGGGD